MEKHKKHRISILLGRPLGADTLVLCFLCFSFCFYVCLCFCMFLCHKKHKKHKKNIKEHKNKEWEETKKYPGRRIRPRTAGGRVVCSAYGRRMQCATKDSTCIRRGCRATGRVRRAACRATRPQRRGWWGAGVAGTTTRPSNHQTQRFFAAPERKLASRLAAVHA